jgi:DNA-binding GntR family transcriptional regulator
MPTATENAYTAIRDGILNGTYKPETMLGEASLAAELGVSRTPVRVALARLQDDGWLTIYPKRGALVRGLSDKMTSDLADARLVLEASSVQRATLDRRRALAARLEQEIDNQKRAFAEHDLRTFIECMIMFHRSFVEVGGNLVLIELNDRIADRQRFLLFSSGETLMARGADIITEHEELVEQLQVEDPHGFGDALRTHLVDTFGSELPLLPH